MFCSVLDVITCSRQHLSNGTWIYFSNKAYLDLHAFISHDSVIIFIKHIICLKVSVASLYAGADSAFVRVKKKEREREKEKKIAPPGGGGGGGCNQLQTHAYKIIYKIW